MKIISKHRDFYDSGVAYGLDTEITYVRYARDLEVFAPIHNDTWSGDIEFENGVIGWCGELFPFVRASPEYSCLAKKEVHDAIFYDADLFEEYLSAQGIKPEKYKSRGRWVDQKVRILDTFEPNQWDQLKNVFYEHNIPIFLGSRDHNFHSSRMEARRKGQNRHLGHYSNAFFEAHPILDPYEFYRVKPHFEAFQELQSFISGTLTDPSRNMIEISDKDKLHKRGFDKMSFRTAPGYKPNRKRKKKNAPT